MKKTLLQFSLLTGFALATLSGFSQTRYVDDVFTSINKVENVEFDSNRSVNILFGQVPNQLPIITAKLFCDIYTPPPTDAQNKRPVVIVMHTGSYLPAIVNRQTTGNRKDSAIVELCTRFAKKGYVAVAMDNRMGWNPQSTVQLDATEQLLKATFRGIQDARNCIRFIRTNAETYGVDTSKIIVGGQGTGGYIAYALGSVNKREEIEDNLKFLRGNGSPMVSIDTLGDWNGVGGFQYPQPIGYINYTGDAAISANAHMTFSYGGAMGDLGWMDSSSLPVVALQMVNDPFAPYNTGNVVVPVTNITVIPDASGAGHVIPRANELGVNDSINVKIFEDPISERAMQLSGNVKNVYPLYPAYALDNAPWEWWDSATMVNTNFGSFYGMPIPASGRVADSTSRVLNPFVSAAKGKAYIDTVVSFVAPRIAAQFNLATFKRVGIKEADLSHRLSVYPNPASDLIQVNFDAKGEQITKVILVDITGRILVDNTPASNQFSMPLIGINPGLYFMHLQTKNGQYATKRILIK